MANIKQQKKRVLIAQRQRLENLRYKSTVRTLFRTLQDNVNAGDKETAAGTHRELVRLLDRASARNVLHANTAARKKARAARLLVSEPVKEAKVVRRTKKKAAPQRAPKKAAAEKAAAAKAAAAEAAAPEAAVEETTAPEAAAEATPAPAEDAAPEAEAAPADEAAAGDDAGATEEG
jgi:ribosomal protein S20